MRRESLVIQGAYTDYNIEFKKDILIKKEKESIVIRFYEPAAFVLKGKVAKMIFKSNDPKNHTMNDNFINGSLHLKWT